MALTSAGRIVCLSLLFAYAASAYTFERKYVHGEVDEYETLVQPVNFDGELAGVTRHRTVIEGGVGQEEIRFVRVSETNAGDLSSRFGDAKLRLSLHASASALSSWSSAEPIVGQLVDALQTFYIAQHPSAGTSRVESPGEVYVSPELFDEDWSQRPNTVAGRRQSAIRVEMSSEDEETGSREIIA